MKNLKSRYGDLLWLAYLDLADTPAIHGVVNKAFTDLDKIDVVVNNAGYGLLGAAEELTDEQIIHQISVNLIGSIQVARAALPHLRRHGGGRIIQVSSMGGQIAYPGGSLYHASKWGIEGFFEMIDSVDQHPAPKRIALGSDAYMMIHKALTERLAALEAQKDIAFSTDCPASASPEAVSLVTLK